MTDALLYETSQLLIVLETANSRNRTLTFHWIASIMLSYVSDK